MIRYAFSIYIAFTMYLDLNIMYIKMWNSKNYVYKKSEQDLQFGIERVQNYNTLHLLLDRWNHGWTLFLAWKLHIHYLFLQGKKCLPFTPNVCTKVNQLWSNLAKKRMWCLWSLDTAEAKCVIADLYVAVVDT